MSNNETSILEQSVLRYSRTVFLLPFFAFIYYSGNDVSRYGVWDEGSDNGTKRYWATKWYTLVLARRIKVAEWILTGYTTDLAEVAVIVGQLNGM